MYAAQPMLGPQPRCCGCIPLRIGSGIICLIWAGFSMYLAVLSFQNTSLIYSYMTQAATMVYGVVNLILSLVSAGGIVILIIDRGTHVTSLSHAIWVSVFLVLVDGLVNVILFIINKTDYHSWCINSSSSTIQKDFTSGNNTVNNFDFQHDYYNCNHLWQDEVKFGIIFYILMFAFYVYWAMCIYSFRLFRPEYISDADIRHAQSYNMPLMGGPPAIPQPAMINNPAAPGGPYPPDRSVIVLNNAKPSKRTKDFSFRNIKKSIRNKKIVEPLRKDSQFSIGFKLSPDGKIIDIESAPSPTPTYNTATVDYNYIKRKPVDDNQDDKYY
ncbi:hypothetical protein CU097_010464 [Rhizopus azygosporus]|uniref:MARVEL domain-containing protein n=2 Tax=Rhizopus TaxID=4842 RepID=A0A367JUQ4_RHIAZ|nr:hypothetical protein CU097_010464 [Rhizopus azygosporus]